ncbi:MAG TPA: hypothetical protein VGQ33_15920, partial [Vicinamibacteria bacterium]|nr:hypothetical protein [Vicinamibacteria bacterium]
MNRPAVLLGSPKPPAAAAVVARFGPILGKRFAAANRPLLEQAHLACTGLKRSAAGIRGHG